MISACDSQDFVPFGREYVRHHPGEFQIQVQNVSHVDASTPLLKSFRDFSLQDTAASKVSGNCGKLCPFPSAVQMPSVSKPLSSNP